jgi:hypothetical protein
VHDLAEPPRTDVPAVTSDVGLDRYRRARQLNDLWVTVIDALRV